MKISLAKFIGIFITSAFVFQFISNSLLGSELGLFAMNNDWYPGMTSSVAWQSTLAKIIYPLKLILIGPPSQLLNDPDPAPPVLLIGFSLYWSVLAAAIYYLIRIFKRKTINV